MGVRAVRGAITVDHDSAHEIHQRTSALLSAVLERNDLSADDIISITFTATKDVASLPPAVAARDMGLTDVPLICVQEMAVEGGLPMCIRLLLHIESDAPKSAIHHVFLRGATVLRPDLAAPGDEQDTGASAVQ